MGAVISPISRKTEIPQDCAHPIWNHAMTELYKLKSGIEVPKPLSYYEVGDLNIDIELFYPDFSCHEKYSTRLVRYAIREMSETSLFYLTEQEAVQATKAIIGE